MERTQFIIKIYYDRYKIKILFKCNLLNIKNNKLMIGIIITFLLIAILYLIYYYNHYSEIRFYPDEIWNYIDNNSKLDDYILILKLSNIFHISSKQSRLLIKYWIEDDDVSFLRVCSRIHNIKIKKRKD